MYIYDLPSRFNSDWLSDKRCSNHLFAAEVALHRALLSSDVRTFEPGEADFFFVPVYVSCNFSTVNGFPAIGHARSLLSSAVALVSSEHPFWNRSGGSDHVFVASHDYGACFHAMVGTELNLLHQQNQNNFSFSTFPLITSTFLLFLEGGQSSSRWDSRFLKELYRAADIWCKSQAPMSGRRECRHSAVHSAGDGS